MTLTKVTLFCKLSVSVSVRHSPDSIDVSRPMPYARYEIAQPYELSLFVRFNLQPSRFSRRILFSFFVRSGKMKTVVLSGQMVEAGTLLAQRSLALTGFLRVRLEGNRKVQGTVRLQFTALIRLNKITISRVRSFGYPRS